MKIAILSTLCFTLLVAFAEANLKEDFEEISALIPAEEIRNLTKHYVHNDRGVRRVFGYVKHSKLAKRVRADVARDPDVQALRKWVKERLGDSNASTEESQSESQESHERPPHERPPHERPPHERPPHERPPHERPPHERPPHERPPHERPPQEPEESQEPQQSESQESHERPPHERPPHERPPHERPPHERPPHERPPHERPPQEPQEPEQQPPEEQQPEEPQDPSDVIDMLPSFTRLFVFDAPESLARSRPEQGLGGWPAYAKDLLELLPLQEIGELVQKKIEEGGDYAELYHLVQSHRDTYERLLRLPSVRAHRRVLKRLEVDVDAVDRAVRQFYGWVDEPPSTPEPPSSPEESTTVEPSAEPTALE